MENAREPRILCEKCGNGQLLDNGAAAVAHPGRGEPQRCDVGAESRCPAVSPQHTQAHSDGSRRAFPARDPRQSGGVAGLDCERRDRPRRADRHAQGQHGPDLRGRLYCAVTPGVLETIPEGPPRLALRDSAGGPHRGRARRGNRGGPRTGARYCIAHARAFAHHCRRLTGLSKRPDAAVRSVRACRV